MDSSFKIGQKVRLQWLGSDQTNTGRIVKVFQARLRIYMHDTGGGIFDYDTRDGGKTWTEMDNIGSPVTITAV